jgi:preprotein translocase subunit SecD
MNTKLMKDWRIVLFVVLLIGSLIAIAPSTEKSVIVKSVSADSPLYGKLAVGDRLEWINERTIASPDDIAPFEDFVGTLRFVHNGKLDLADIKTPGLGLTLEEQTFGKVKFGLDIVGGTRVLLEPKGNVTADIIQQTIATLQTRINIYGLKEAKFQAVNDVITGKKYVQIEMTGGSRQEIDSLLARQGKFDAKMPKAVLLTDGRGELLNKTVVVSGGSLTVDGKPYAVNGTLVINGVPFQVLNLSSSSVTFLATVLTGNDVTSVCITEQAGICASRITKLQTGYQFMFQITVSDDGARKFADVTRGMRQIVEPATGESYLESKIYFYIDDNPITELNVGADLAGRALTDPSINGFRKTRDEAVKEKLALQSILQSGSLPVTLEVTRVDQISPTLGAGFLKSAVLSGALAALGVIAVLFVRYRKLKLALPVAFTAISEVIMILGVAATISWTIDLASLAAIIATVGTGVDAQIMIIDEMLMGAHHKIYTAKERIKRAFFIIFGSASTVIAAMLPMAIIGIGAMRGFAIVTSIGVLIGIFITRPAFGKIAEIILAKDIESEKQQ